MNKIIFILILLLICFSVSSANFTIQYNRALGKISYFTIQNIKIDKTGILKLKKIFPININITGVRLYHNGRYIPCKYKNTLKYLTLKKTGLRDTTADLFLDFQIDMKIYRHFVLPGFNFFIPLYIFQPQTNGIDNDYESECFVELPPDWQILSPANWDNIYEEKEEKPLYHFKGKWQEYPVVLTKKNILNLNQFTNDNSTDIYFYGKKNLNYIFKHEEKTNLRIKRLRSYIKHIEEYLDISLSNKDFNFLIYSGLMNITLAIDNSIIVSSLHYNFLNSKYEKKYSYELIYEMTYSILWSKIDYNNFEHDSWIIDGIAHLTAINYFEKNYDLNLNETNSNKFIKFFLGKRNSIYTRSASMFRDFIRFKKIETIQNDNTLKFLGYNYRSQTLKNRYSIQLLYNLINLSNKEKVQLFIRKILLENEEITVNIFLDSLTKNFDEDTAYLIKNIMEDYPIVDYKLKIKDKQAWIIRKKGEVVLPLEVGIKYKDKTEKKIIIIMKDEEYLLDLDLKEVRNISLDPNSLIDEIIEINNYYRLPVNFSLLTPVYAQDSYTFAVSAVMLNYISTIHFGGTVSGGWNMKAFTPNTLTKPGFLWGLDAGYGYDSDGKFKNPHNGFINGFFETSIYPLSVWSPHIYSQIFFFSGESISFKFGSRSFIPPVINTEHDKLFFNHSWDGGVDVKLKFHPINSLDMNINFGYRFYFKSRFYNLEGIIATNIDFDGMKFRDVNLGFQLDNKFDFRIFELGIRAGIMKGFFPRMGYEYYRPKITRFSLVTQSVGYYETIANNLAHASSLLIELPYPTMDFLTLHNYYLFKLILYSEPLLEPMATFGMGIYIDYLLPMVIMSYNNKLIWRNDLLRTLMIGFMIKIDIMRKTSIIFRATSIPLYWVNNQVNNFYFRPGPVLPKILSLVLFEVRSFL